MADRPCPRCAQALHWASDCKSKFYADGRTLRGFGKRAEERETAHDNNKYGPETAEQHLASTVPPATAGSAGGDLATAQLVTLDTTAVVLIPSGVMGPLGNGRSALLLGRSSTTQMGLFVLPGVIDADFAGEIKIMAWTWSSPCFVPKGQRIAQLVPLLSVISPRKGGFGSTGKPVVLWSKQVSKEQSLLHCQVHDQHFSGLVDTGADVTIINVSDWPPEWPLRDLTSAIVGVGGPQRPKQSAKILTLKVPDGWIAQAAPYVLPVPCTLWGRDLLSQWGIFLKTNFQ